MTHGGRGVASFCKRTCKMTQRPYPHASLPSSPSWHFVRGGSFACQFGRVMYTFYLLRANAAFELAWRDVRAGRRSTIGNRVYAKSVSGVQIPVPPPFAGSISPRGEVAERLNAAVSKTVLPVNPVTRVRIPASPPLLLRRSNERRFAAAARRRGTHIRPLFCALRWPKPTWRKGGPAARTTTPLADLLRQPEIANTSAEP